ncbi:MAG: ABC transporter ATP-binding protein [Thermoguttaceae bacterium]
MNNVIPMYANNVLLRTEHLTKLYTDGQVSALLDVSVEIHHGEYVSIMGPSGSGKSTLLNLLGALDSPTSGELYFEGKPLSSIRNLNKLRAQKFGFIFQSFYLLPVLTAVENVQVPMFEGSRLSASGRVKKAVELLDIVGLAHRLHHLPEQLSVGERQRVAIARALANDPVLLLADEPTGNLDSKSAIGIFELIEKLHRDRNMTIVLITHDDALGQRAERTVRIQDGRLKSDTRRGATPSASAVSHGSVAAPLPPLTSVPVSNLGSGPRAAGRPKSVLPPFAVQ